MKRGNQEAVGSALSHRIDLDLASGAHLKLLYFAEGEMRWIFSYHYVGEKKPGYAPDVVNQVRLTADYAAGCLMAAFVLSMHVILPSHLGQEYFVGMDISPGAKTYFEFHYTRGEGMYQLFEICKGARERLRLDEQGPALLRPIEFPFPILDRLPTEGSHIRVPFRLNSGETAHFELPLRTL